MTIDVLQAQELIDWLRGAGLVVTPTAEGLVIDVEDRRYRVAAEGELYTVRARERGTDRGVVFASARFADVEKFLTFTFAYERRSKLRLPPLPELAPIPYSIERVAPGFTAVPASGHYDLHWTDADGTARAITGVGMFAAVDFSHYALLTPDELRRAIDDPAAEPLVSSGGHA